MSELEVRIVKMEDGSEVNFGKRANLLTSFEGTTVSFKLFTGKVITWVVEGIDTLTDFQKTVYVYGLTEKVKSNLAPVKDVSEMEIAIQKQILNLTSGIFFTRGTSSSAIILDNLQKAWAFVKSEQEGYKHWEDLEDATVTREVASAWNELTRPAKNLIRKNVYVVIQKSKLDLADGVEATLV
jgi:hypothetical protein